MLEEVFLESSKAKNQAKMDMHLSLVFYDIHNKISRT